MVHSPCISERCDDGNDQCIKCFPKSFQAYTNKRYKKLSFVGTSQW